MSGVLVESREVAEEAGSLSIHGLPLGSRPTGTWLVHIEAYPKPQRGYGVWAEHVPTGAVVPADGSRVLAGTLALARDRAGAMATVFRGTMREYDWRASR